MATKRPPTPKFVLQVRDLLVLAIVILLGVAEGRLIAAICFGSIGRANYRLAQLVRAGYLRRYLVPTAPRFARGLYAVGPVAASVVAQALAAQRVDPLPEELDRMLKPVPLARLNHTLAVGRIYQALVMAVRDSVFQIERWLPEPMLWTRFEVAYGTGRNRTHTFAPDAFARLEIPSQKLTINCFIECDCSGLVNADDYAHKLAAWTAFVSHGVADDIFGTGCHTLLVVAPDATRRRRLASYVTSAGTPAVIFSTFDALDQYGLDRCYWGAGAHTPISMADVPTYIAHERDKS